MILFQLDIPRFDSFCQEICHNFWSSCSFLATHRSNISQLQCQTHITVWRRFVLLFFLRQIKIWETGYQNLVDSCFCWPNILKIRFTHDYVMRCEQKRNSCYIWRFDFCFGILWYFPVFVFGSTWTWKPVKLF